jgi:hypothetical protein
VTTRAPELPPVGTERCEPMTTPQVNEVPLPLEATTRDTFGDAAEEPREAAQSVPGIEWQPRVDGVRLPDC